MAASPRLRDYTLDVHTEQRALDFARYIACSVEAGGALTATAEVFARKCPTALSLSLIEKAATAIGTTSDPAWASPLTGALRPLPQAFLQLLSERTVIGQLTGLLRVPFTVPIAYQTGAGVYGWTAEGLSKPTTALAFGSTTLKPAKASGIVVVSSELLTLAQPGSDRALLEALTRGVARFLDDQFTNPANAPVAGVHPGSLTNGVTPITSTGAAVADLKALLAAWATANPHGDTPTLICSPANAAALRLAAPAGTVPALVTSSVLGSTVILVDASAIALAEGELALDTSRHALLQLDTAPASPPTGVVSLWQENLVGLRAERVVNWQKLHAGAAQWMTATWTTTP